MLLLASKIYTLTTWGDSSPGSIWLKSIAKSVDHILAHHQLTWSHLKRRCWWSGQILLRCWEIWNWFLLKRLPVVRPDTVEMSAWGVAALAGIQVRQHWHLAAWGGSFLFESWVLISTVKSQGGIWKGREEVASLRPKGKEFLRKEGRGPIVEAQYKRWWSA